MQSNFSFLQQNWNAVYQAAAEAERHARVAPVTSAMYSRQSLELLIHWLYENDEDLKSPHSTTLAARMHEPSFRRILPPSLYKDLDYIRIAGNAAVHGGNANATAAMAALQYLHRFCAWVARLYSAGEMKTPAFDAALLPTQSISEQTRAQLQELQTQIEQYIAELAAERQQRLAVEAELEVIKTQQAAVRTIKAQNQALPLPPEPFNEAETRRLFIDVLLREAGWNPDAPRVCEYPLQGLSVHVNPTGKGAADYVLWGDNGLPLAVIEAKRTGKKAHEGQFQAEAYADALERMHGQRPIIFFTNGFKTWLWDDTFYPPRAVQGFYTKEELMLLIHRRQSRRDLRGFKPDTNIADRYYQLEAVQRVGETLVTELEGSLRGKRRAALLVMATGAGKTRTAASIVDMLVQCNWAKRILFLADRNALVTQAKNAFKKLLPHLSAIDLTKEKEDDTTRLVFSTYPTILNRIDRARLGDERFYGVGHFDVIIVDEAHRSVYQKYQAIFEYFDAIKLGLTATPRSDADRDTYDLFECETGNPTFFYELDQAVQDGYLVPPLGKSVSLGFLRRGIHYKDLSEAEKAEYEATFRDEAGDVPDLIEATALNEWLFNLDTIDRVIHHLMTEGLKIKGGDRLGKSIVFARNHAHAEKIWERFNRQYPQYGGKFCKVIDNYDRFAQQAIDDFSDPQKLPQIAISVDMLDTGIDVPDILNLVFFKPVYSSAKYWQMIGRGTRLRPATFGPDEDKQHFYLFDFCGNFEFFDHQPDGITASVPASLSQRLFQAKLELAQCIRQQELQEYQALRQELLDGCYAEVSRLYQQRENFQVRMQLETITPFKDRNRWSFLSKEDTNALLQHIAPLVQMQDEDEAAKRFDLMLLQLQTGILQKDANATNHAVRKIAEQGHDLLQLSHLPAVQAQLATIQQTQDDYFWQHLTLTSAEQLRQNLRSLVALIPKNGKSAKETHFADRVLEFREVAVMPPYLRMESYKQRVERFVRQNQNHITIHKLRTNQPISTAELEALENLLFDCSERGTREDYVREYGEKPLGVFIRSILGMDANAAKQAFAEFLQRGNLSADQMTFINTLINFLTQNGVIEKRMLVSPPFTDAHHDGIFGLFDTEDQTRIVYLIERINQGAKVG
jgi:type I restriction enzyme R subunit